MMMCASPFCRWKVRRRFREFFELYEELVSLRSSMEKLDFPMRRPSLYETTHSVNDRRVRLERYVRRVAGMLFSATQSNVPLSGFPTVRDLQFT